jgi:hypothetical protein
MHSFCAVVVRIQRTGSTLSRKNDVPVSSSSGATVVVGWMMLDVVDEFEFPITGKKRGAIQSSGSFYYSAERA